MPAFVVRFGGAPYAYVNRCNHVQVELDGAPGEFFDIWGAHLICATHGALYDPVTGACRGGPCRGGGLEPLTVYEHDGGVWLKENGEVLYGG